MTESLSQSGIPLKRVYTPQDMPGFAYETNLNDPGSYPYTRGRHAGIHAAGSWIQRELSGEGEPERANRQLLYLLQKGQTGVDVIGDAPTMAWLDPDHPFARHTVGTQGVSLCCLDDYRELYRDIPLDTISVSHSLPATYSLAALYLVAKEHHVPPAKLRGSLVQDAFYCEDCSYAKYMPFRLRLRLTADSIEFCGDEMPKFHGFLEDTYYFSEVGLDSVEEMALGFIEIRYVVRELLKRGVAIDRFAPRIAILVNCRMDFFEEIAKIRATRRLFARMMREEFGAQDPRSLSAAITCHTSGLSLTSQQPVNNIVRGTVQALALAIAGVQAIEISAFDEAYRTPSPESHLIALRTQQIVDLESNVARVADPLGGSYFVEALTGDLEKRIWDMVLSIEAKGDPAELSDKGWFRSLFDKAAERYAAQIREGKLPKVGLNVHQVPPEEDTMLRDVAERKMDPCWGRIEQVQEMKRKRDQGRLAAVLSDLYRAAKAEGENLMWPMIGATEAGATMGEVGGILRMAYGSRYDPVGGTEPPVSL